MKAWHVQTLDGEHQEVVFADKRGVAIQKSESMGWEDYINIRATRLKYADDLEKKPDELVKVKLENGWWIECKSCVFPVTNECEGYRIQEGKVYCGKCETGARR